LTQLSSTPGLQFPGDLKNEFTENFLHYLAPIPLQQDDIMESIQFELQHNEFVKLLLESIGDGIFVLDTHGAIIGWNPAMEKIT